MQPKVYHADKTVFRAKAPVASGKRRIARLELEDGTMLMLDETSLPLTIGRDIDCDVSLPDSHVSRRHCELFLKDGALSLKDRSSNGTQVGGKRVKGKTVALAKKTRLILGGDTRIIVTPYSEAESSERRGIPDRRGDSRRRAERRQRKAVVPFEQRWHERRHPIERRLAARR